MNTQKTAPRLLIVSGKKGAGKDTLAPRIVNRLNIDNAVHLSCADPLKDLVDKFIVEVRSSDTPAQAEKAILAVDPEMPQKFAALLVDTLFTAVHEDPAEHSRSHSLPAVRALQIYGTDFRRAQDPDYWVKLAVQSAVEVISSGAFPYFTDARFPNEVSGLSAVGGLSVRLDVDPAEQARRLQDRDGRVPDPEELNHPSETALDDYPHFDIRVHSDDGIDPTLQQIMDQLSE